MARRLPPSSSLSSSLTILSHLLARMLDEAVASTASALRIRPRFFEGGFGDLKIVDFSKDELVASLSKFDQEKRRRFAAWVEEAERGPVLEVRAKNRVSTVRTMRKRKENIFSTSITLRPPPPPTHKRSSSGPLSSPATGTASPTF